MEEGGMVLSRRKFTREFKLAALRQLEAGASVAEVARAYEVNPNVLQRWRREFREAPATAFPGPGKRQQGRPCSRAREHGTHGRLCGLYGQ